jgi:hypothetical protein
MRTIKVILGLGCFLAALLPGLIAVAEFSTGGGTWWNFLLSCGFAFLALGLVRTGWILIVSRSLVLPGLTRAIIAVTILSGILPAAWMIFSPWNRMPSTAACINNLRQIESAKQQWALENGKTANDVPSWDDIRPYIGRGEKGEMPQCPQGGSYILGRIGESPKCSIGGPSHTLNYVEHGLPWVPIAVGCLACLSVGSQLIVARRHGA